MGSEQHLHETREGLEAGVSAAMLVSFVLTADSYIDLVANIGFEGSKGGSKIPPCFLGGSGGGCNDHKLYKWSNCSKSDIKGSLSVTSKVLFIIVSMRLKCGICGDKIFCIIFSS
jgi:hypothetical protein